EAAPEQPVGRAAREAGSDRRRHAPRGDRRHAAAAGPDDRRLVGGYAGMDRETGAVTRELRLVAPAKINWTLEALRERPDGYHELRSVLQTIALHDTVTLSEAHETSLEIDGAPILAEAPPETNLAFRAAVALRERTGVRRGVNMRIEKRIPVAAGLG